MANYSAMKSYRKKNNLYYFTFSPNSEKPIKAVIRHLLPDTPAEGTSSSLNNLGFNVINERQMKENMKSTQRTNPRGNPPSIPCYLNKKCNISRDIQAE
jgi:hypothetical protein